MVSGNFSSFVFVAVDGDGDDDDDVEKDMVGIVLLILNIKDVEEEQEDGRKWRRVWVIKLRELYFDDSGGIFEDTFLYSCGMF